MFKGCAQKQPDLAAASSMTCQCQCACRNTGKPGVFMSQKIVEAYQWGPDVPISHAFTRSPQEVCKQPPPAGLQPPQATTGPWMRCRTPRVAAMRSIDAINLKRALRVKASGCRAPCSCRPPVQPLRWRLQARLPAHAAPAPAAAGSATWSRPCRPAGSVTWQTVNPHPL